MVLLNYESLNVPLYILMCKCGKGSSRLRCMNLFSFKRIPDELNCARFIWKHVFLWRGDCCQSRLFERSLWMISFLLFPRHQTNQSIVLSIFLTLWLNNHGFRCISSYFLARKHRTACHYTYTCVKRCWYLNAVVHGHFCGSLNIFARWEDVRDVISFIRYNVQQFV